MPGSLQMKLPSSVGQKKIKALEQMLLELGVGECGGQPLRTSPPRLRMKAGHGGQFRLLASPQHPSSVPVPSTHLPTELSPTPTEELVHMFNELRSDLVLLYELKQACANCEYELQMLRHRHEALARAGVLGGPATPASGPAPAPAEPAVPEPGLGPDPSKDAIIDVVGAPLTPNSVRGQESANWPC